jgi:hypothetical protein
VSYFSKSSNCLLYMGTSVATTLPAVGADTMRVVPLLGAITPAPNTLSVAFFNILNDVLRRSIGGKLQDKSWEGNFVVDDAQQVHNDFINDSKVAGGQKRNWKILYPNGRIVTFVGFVSNYAEDQLEASDTPDVFRASFTITQDGAEIITFP